MGNVASAAFAPSFGAKAVVIRRRLVRSRWRCAGTARHPFACRGLALGVAREVGHQHWHVVLEPPRSEIYIYMHIGLYMVATVPTPRTTNWGASTSK